MATQYLSMDDARRILRAEFVEVVCVELAQFAKFRRDGLAAHEAAGLLGLDEETAARYVRTIARITGEEQVVRRALAAVDDALEPAPALELIQDRTQKSETAPVAPEAVENPEGNHS